jgi:DHA1 family bicyclomycin/chloramphenicol resistance-like MFS transporter
MSTSSKSPALLLLTAIVLLGCFPLDVILPSFPALSDYFSTPGANIALSISLFAIGVAFAQLLLGPLSDVLGRKKLLLAGLGVSIIGAAGCILSTQYPWFIFFRLLQALGCGCFVLAHALIQDIFSEHERGRVRIFLTTASGIFISTSPLPARSHFPKPWPGSPRTPGRPRRWPAPFCSSLAG